MRPHIFHFIIPAANMRVNKNSEPKLFYSIVAFFFPHIINCIQPGRGK